MPLFRVSKPRVETTPAVGGALVSGVALPIAWLGIRSSEGAAVWDPAFPTVFLVPFTGTWELQAYVLVDLLAASTINLRSTINGGSPDWAVNLRRETASANNIAASYSRYLQAGDQLVWQVLLSGGSGSIRTGVGGAAARRTGPERWT